MKYTLLLILVTHLAFAQSLRQGAFFTKEEAIAEHEKMTSLYANQKTWEARKDLLVKGILEGAGIKEMPKNKFIKANFHGKRILDGYSVENVFFESIPGVYVSGNLYKPLKSEGKAPAILCPHGHGRDLNNRKMAYVQQRCATLARMGAVVFAYDMLGYGDFLQADHKIKNVFKLQLINGSRIIDFLTQMREVDASKIAITGESGGGTQTFMLAAVDPRIAVSVPVVMVSSYFFGGCQCESGMPVHVREHHTTTNVEIAACAAPRPQMLISDGDDWTKYTPEIEYPFIRNIYGYYESENALENVHLPDEKHDYGPSKREAAYHFLAKHLGLSLDEMIINNSVDETPNVILSEDQLTVFTAEYPRPKNAVMGDEALTALIEKY